MRDPDVRPALTDRLEFELRLIPGVVAVGSTADGVSITAASPAAAGAARELARVRLGDDVEIVVHTAAPATTLPLDTLTQILQVPGVRTCTAQRAPDGTITGLEVTADSIRAADRVHDLVTTTVDATFARERLQVALEIPLTQDAGT